MWFKNLVVYRIGAGWSPAPEDFEAKLAATPLRKCGGFEMETRGWTAPRHEGQFLYTQQRQWLIALGHEQKLLPASVVRQVAEERIAERESMLGNRMGRKQKRDIRDQVQSELLPRALAKRASTFAWIDTANGWLAIDAAGEPKAEQFLEVLRRTEDGLSLARLETQMSPATAMTRWLVQGDVDGPFTIDQDLELRAPDTSKATVRWARHPLEGKDVRDHIAAGKQAVRLGLTWNERISFVLTEQLHVKRLSFLDIVERETPSEEEVENEDERFDIDFALMTGELSRLLADLVEALGGEKAAEAGVRRTLEKSAA
jgi:recombination associated protein RdgC